MNKLTKVEKHKSFRLTQMFVSEVILTGIRFNLNSTGFKVQSTSKFLKPKVKLVKDQSLCTDLLHVRSSALLFLNQLTYCKTAVL